MISRVDRQDIVDRLRAAGCVFAEEEADLILAEGAGAGETLAMVERRAAGEPLETVVGWAAFLGLRVPVAPGVFVPRLRTEALAIAAIEATPDDGVVVDLCCGAAPIALAVLAARPGIRLHAADIDPVAVELATRTLGANARVSTAVGDLFDAVPSALRGRIDVLTANAPYVATRDIPLLPAEARDHEPLVTLDGGGDGLAVLRRVLADAPGWLAPHGVVLSEIAEHQTAAALEAARAHFHEATTADDDERGARVMIARTPRHAT